MRTRLKDIAEHLNLSTGLVSGVLNDRPNVWASEQTRARILEAAQTLNYQPSAAAQALSKGRSKTVALVYRRLEGFDYRLAYTGLVDVFSAELQGRGYDLQVANFSTQEEVLDHLQKLASTRACDAIILWGREQDTEPQGELLESLRVPFLVKGRHEQFHPTWKQIDFDHEWMMEQSVHHLVDLGHRRLAYIGFSHEDAYVQSLHRGFVRAHEERLGALPEPQFMAEIPDQTEPNERTIMKWLALPEDQRPTAFVIGSGNSAWQALEASLAHIGRVLGSGATDYAASGVTAFPFTLMFGQAMVYHGIEMDNLPRVASPSILESILTGKESESVIRFRPDLSPAPTLELLKHGVKFVTETMTHEVDQK